MYCLYDNCLCNDSTKTKCIVLYDNCYVMIPGKPNVLFVYESAYPSHIENIYKFKDFLEYNCLLNTKLDLIDIPKTDSMVSMLSII